MTVTDLFRTLPGPYASWEYALIRTFSRRISRLQPQRFQVNTGRQFEPGDGGNQEIFNI